jgi:hypothetical protein
MICQNCRERVDNDLIFCTNCGERLSVTADQASTVVMNEPVLTKPSKQAHPTKGNSNLKWVALILTIMAIPASLLIAYLLLANSKSQSVSDKSNTNSVPSINRKVNSNSQNKMPNETTGNANVSNSNIAVSEANVNSNSSNSNRNDSAKGQTQIIDERIEIAPGAHLAYPFKLDSEAKIFGEAKVLQGAAIEGYVYFQDMFDQHFPDANYKVFDFDGKNPKVEQTLVKGDYVLVFINKNKTSATIQANFITDKIKL